MPNAPPAGPFTIVALISARGGGDWPAVVALAVGLHKRGHAVSLVCDTSTEAASHSTGLLTICVRPALEQGDIRLAIARSAEIGPETPNPLTGWGRVCAPSLQARIQPHKPMILLGSLLCLGLADQLASDLWIPWCFVNPAFYFGEDSARPWDATSSASASVRIGIRFNPCYRKQTSSYMPRIWLLTSLRPSCRGITAMSVPCFGSRLWLVPNFFVRPVRHGCSCR